MASITPEEEEEEKAMAEDAPTAAAAAVAPFTKEEQAIKKRNNNDDDTASVSEEDFSDNEEDMPLLKYSRLIGSLPRLPRRDSSSSAGPSRCLSVQCTCAALGKLVLTPELLAEASSGDGGTSNKPISMAASQRPSDLVWKHPHYLLAVGFQNGRVALVDARTASAVAPADQLVVASGKDPIVDACFDASGTFLAAINKRGMCAIWELRFTASRPTLLDEVATATAPATRTIEVPQEPAGNMFSNFLTTFKVPTGHPTTAASSSQPPTAAKTAPSTLISTTSSIQVSRISYPASFGTPTAMKLDPSYKRRREKSILVGFEDGRLILTKRGFFQRRSDSIIYQGVTGPDYQGIEAIEWRGNLVVWADASGIKIVDAETWVRQAHVDRPKGARSVLYPTISSLRPSLCFETSSDILIAWGDCLMSMSIKEKTESREPSDAAVTAAAGPNASMPESEKQRKVVCDMAWELDSVACGVVPLDEEHVAILVLVPLEDEVEEATPQDRSLIRNELELQVVSRQHGTIVYADALPILLPPSQNEERRRDMEAACAFGLLSSFALPRMEDSAEAEENRQSMEDEDLDFQMSLFSSGATASKPTFQDPHRKWSLHNVSFRYDDKEAPNSDQRTANLQKTVKVADGESELGEPALDLEQEDDAQSVDSDDYSFVLQPWTPPEEDEKLESLRVSPPFMIVCAPFDAVLVRTREVDDAVSHALAANKRGLALKRALQHKRHLRQYELNHLIDEYLTAVLRLNSGTGKVRDVKNSRPLSVRRLQLAAQSMPMLLGGSIRMWEKWADLFGKIPGGLFVLRENLPVRDPVLPEQVYERALLKMLSEVEEMLVSDNDGERQTPDVDTDAVRHLVSAVKAWGPLQSLREQIRFYKYHDEKQQKKLHQEDPMLNSSLVDAEDALDLRIHQTAAGYLQLPSTSSEQQGFREASPPRSTLNLSSDSLFDIESVLSVVSSHVPLINGGECTVGPDLANNKAALEACAELYMMKGKYEMALKCFLLIGCLHPPYSLTEIENEAISLVNRLEIRRRSSIAALSLEGSQRYGFVLAMIEYHHLHRCLLDDDLLLSTAGGEPMTSLEELSPPLISLMQLVGLELIGDFLVEHCVPPPTKKADIIPAFFRSQSSESDSGSKATHDTLPINLVSNHLTSKPKLLHWYLHQIFLRKPEMYVKFPSTAVPPKSVTDLHRSHLELYIEHTDKRDSARFLSGTEAYNLERMTTPLLSFLKAALPLGGIRPEEVRRLLETQRSGIRQGVPSDVLQEPNAFAIELAYVVEHFGKNTEEEAKQVLDLYLNGSQSLMLAVAFAQRNTEHATVLWDSLIEHCLQNNQEDEQKDGSLFGNLLECAALSGADLAHLVTQIPQGMRIEGLRPRLVAAVADYRLKLKMHEAASEAGMKEKILLLRELAHRSRRGVRFLGYVSESSETKEAVSGSAKETSQASDAVTLSRPVKRPSRYQLSFALPIR